MEDTTRSCTPLFVLVPLATGVASCNSTKPANPLTEPETVALLREIVRLIDDGSINLDDGITRSSAVDCTVGGEATVTITADIEYNSEGDSIWSKGDATLVLTDCEADVVNDTLTLNGKPNVQVTAESWIVFDDDLEVAKGEIRYVFEGAVTWLRRNGDSDTCSVDLTWESTEFDEDGDPKGDFRGRMCELDLVIDPHELFSVA